MFPALAVTHRGSIIEARSLLTSLARSLDATPTTTEELRICVSELAQNILDHGGGRGQIEMRADPMARRLDLIAEDQGSGMSFSRAALGPRLGGGGEGLPSLSRFSDGLGICLPSSGGTRLTLVRYVDGSRRGASPKFAWFQRCARPLLHTVQILQRSETLQAEILTPNVGLPVGRVQLSRTPQHAIAETAEGMRLSLIRSGRLTRIPPPLRESNRPVTSIRHRDFVCLSTMPLPRDSGRISDSLSFVTTGLRLASGAWHGAEEEPGLLLIAGYE